DGREPRLPGVRRGPHLPDAGAGAPSPPGAAPKKNPQKWRRRESAKMVSPGVQAGPLLMRALPLITSAALFLAARAEADFGPEALIGPAAGHQRAPDIASDGKSFLIAWRNDASPQAPSIEVLRVEADGTWTGSPVVLTSPRRATSAPAVAACGAGWVVAWTDPEGIAVQVLDRAGAPLHSLSEKARPLGMGGAAPRLGLACDGRGALIVWSEDGQPELRALALPHGETTPRRLRL